MFEKIVLRRSESGAPVTAGQLAEALLYYQNVHLILDYGTFKHLMGQIGIGRLLSLLQRHNFNAVYCEETLGTHSAAVGSQQIHNFAGFTFVGHESVGHLNSKEDRIAYAINDYGVSKSEAQKFAKSFLKFVPIRKLTGDFFIRGGITQAAKQDVEDQAFLLEAVHRILRRLPGAEGFADDVKFEIWDTELGFYVMTNINFKEINARRQKLLPKHDPISSAHFLSAVLDARADLTLASFYGGDFATSATASSIIQSRYSDLLRRTGLNSDARSNFHEVVFPDSPSLQEAIDSGKRGFDDFLKLLDKADRFKEWIGSASPDEGLLRTYMRDITAEGWIQTLPAKTLRYFFTLAIEASNPLAGAVAALTDSFVVEKLLGGWRPNHFVDNRLGPFLEK